MMENVFKIRFKNNGKVTTIGVIDMDDLNEVLKTQAKNSSVECQIGNMPVSMHNAIAEHNAKIEDN